jgi:hypothetical protein
MSLALKLIERVSSRLGVDVSAEILSAAPRSWANVRRDAESVHQSVGGLPDCVTVSISWSSIAEPGTRGPEASTAAPRTCRPRCP